MPFTIFILAAAKVNLLADEHYQKLTRLAE